MSRWRTFAAAMILSLAAPRLVEAREARSEQVPNAQKLDCGLCHIDSAGGSARNAFGSQIESMGLDGEGAIETQEVVWSLIYDLDADGDGFTNGYELGDPEGTWVSTDNDPPVEPSLPGDPDSLPCPNGSVHPGEECDGEDLAGQTCLSQGFTGGTLACAADCTFDTSACIAAQFPDQGMTPDPTTDMGNTAMQPNMPSTPGNPQTTNDAGGGNLTASDVNGCAGVLDIEYPDGGFDASLLFLLFFGCRRSRCTD